mmetsp:Transcript_19595/g.34650  ORF Transcript_19595/g.34650 Transcript_19595/m.34650 type:complete len:466 (-) Transcript_19595:132-1529(-)
MGMRGRSRGHDFDWERPSRRSLSVSGSAPAFTAGRSAGLPGAALKQPRTRKGAPPAKLVGQLSSTLAAPLEDCASFESLHHVSLQILERVSTQKLALTALVAAVSGRCSSMLRRGWPSTEEALAALPLLADLWQAGLLYVPGDATRTAVAAAIAALVSGGRKEGLPPGSAPGSLFGALPASAGGGSQAVGRESMEQRLLRWTRSCELFANAASSELLTKEGASSVELLLYEELRRTLAGASADNLRRGAVTIKAGTLHLGRGAAQVSERHHSGRLGMGKGAPGKTGPPSEAAYAAGQATAAAVTEAVSSIAFETLRTSESIREMSETAVETVKAALEEQGFEEPLQPRRPLMTSSPSRPQSRTRLASRPNSGVRIDAGAEFMVNSPGSPVGDPTPSSEHMIVAARRAGDLSALEGGLLRLEAARHEMRRSKVLPKLGQSGQQSMQALGIPAPRVEERRAYEPPKG